ncbi:MAG: DUF3365 domain-containing protein [Persicimonas sp.]
MNNARMMVAIGLILGGAAIFSTACESKPDEKAEPAEPAESAEPAPAPEEAETAEQPEEDTSTAASLEFPEGWTRVEPDGLSDEQKSRLDSAQKAQKALGQTLMGELSSAIEGENYVRGVEVCKQAAPKIAKEVSTEHDLEIGRTSFRIRNPDNAPRDWAEPVVRERVEEQLVLTGPDGQLGYMAPIQMAALCTNCHGTEEQIPAEVEEILAEEYPQDEATGFEAGELRGWFWAEVASAP